MSLLDIETTESDFGHRLAPLAPVSAAIPFVRLGGRRDSAVRPQGRAEAHQRKEMIDVNAVPEMQKPPLARRLCEIVMG